MKSLSCHLAAMFAIIMAALSNVAVNSAAAQAASLDTQIEELHQLREFARDMRGTLDRSQFEPDALLDSLDYEAERIIDFVRLDIAFEQYPGLLRGAAGTLSSRSGNALDQALLLATLLRDAGYEARIARGTLDEAQASRLLLEIQRPGRPVLAIGDAEAAFKVYVRHGALQADDRQAMLAVAQLLQASPDIAEAAKAETADIASFISGQLTAAGVKPGAAGLDSELLAEARDYFWVQFRDAAADSWKNLHPAFGTDNELGELAFTAVFGDSIPDALLHRVRIQMFAERWYNGKLEVFAISDPWERPVANLLTTPVTVGVVPDTLLSRTDTDIEAMVGKARFFVPLLMDALAPGAVFFDRYGTEIDSMAAQDPAAGLFATVQDAFGSALGGLGPDTGLPSISAQWTEFTVIAPDGTEQSHRRAVFDRIGPAARAAGSIPDSLAPATAAELGVMLERQTLMVHAGAMARGEAMDLALTQIVDSVDLVIEMTQSLYDSRGFVPPSDLGGQSNAWPGYPTLFATLDIAARLSQAHRIYRSAPALLLHRTGLLADGGVSEGVDIVTNPRRAIRLQGSPDLDPSMLMQVGVWETQVESAVVNKDGLISNTMLVFEQAQAAGTALMVAAPGQATEPIGLPADSRYHLMRDLDRGYAVLAPTSTAGLSLPGWWRVHTQTGETLGMLGDGRGSAISEFLITHSNSISLAFLAVGLFGCQQDFAETGSQPGGTQRAACCIGANFLFFGVGWLGGNVVLPASRGFKITEALGGTQAARAYVAQVGALFDSTTSLITICD